MSSEKHLQKSLAKSLENLDFLDFPSFPRFRNLINKLKGDQKAWKLGFLAKSSESLDNIPRSSETLDLKVVLNCVFPGKLGKLKFQLTEQFPRKLGKLRLQVKTADVLPRKLGKLGL